MYCGTYRRLNRTSCASSTVRRERLTARRFGAQRGERFDLITLVADAEPGGLDALQIDYALTREANRFQRLQTPVYFAGVASVLGAAQPRSDNIDLSPCMPRRSR